MLPRTHQTKAVTLLSRATTSPLLKNTTYARLVARALVVADQWMDCTLLKGWSMGRPGIAGSTRLANSWTEGRRQPLRPPTTLLVHCDRAKFHMTLKPDGDLSQTS